MIVVVRSKNTGKSILQSRRLLSQMTPQIIRSIVEGIAAEYSSVNIKLLHHDIRRGVSGAWNEIFERQKET